MYAGLIVLILGAIGLFFVAALFIGLQVLASIKGPKWLGLVIPGFHSITSLILIYLIPYYIGLRSGVILAIVTVIIFFIYLGIFFAGLSKKKQEQQ